MGRVATARMASRFAIGDFSRATLLSVKTLRHYHAVGLLEPSEVDADNGYRYYSENQIPPPLFPIFPLFAIFGLGPKSLFS